MNLIYLSPVPWDSFTQRPHEWVRYFRSCTDGRVLWINPYPTRLPRPSDLYSVGRLNHSVDIGTDTPAWLRVIQPRALPIEPLPGGAWFNAKLWKAMLRDVQRFATGKDTLLVIGKPSALACHVLKAISPRRTSGAST